LSGYEPTEIQLATAEAPGPVVVLESETGSGKTEAALWRFATLFVAGKVDGLYFALPTRVAASQIHGRDVESGCMSDKPKHFPRKPRPSNLRRRCSPMKRRSLLARF
jgi:superfamily II DNA/RNA helicase